MTRRPALLRRVLSHQAAALAADNLGMPAAELAREQAALRAEIIADWTGHSDAPATFAAFLQGVAA